VAGDLLSTGATALVICAESSRRADGVARILGSAGEGRLALTSWDDLAAAPELAGPFHHLIALDPPPLPEGCELLGRAPGPGSERFAHLAWGAPEAGFALAAAEASLSLRAPLAELYRGLRDAGTPEGTELEALLRGGGAHPHPAAMSARMVRVLCELGAVGPPRSRPRPDGPAQTVSFRSRFRAYNRLNAQDPESLRHRAGPRAGEGGQE